MGDIAISWIGFDHGDWSVSDGGITTGDDLASAIYVSLFTDALASSDFTPTDGTQDRRGWWGDSYADPDDGHIGSDLWQLERSKKTASLLPRAQDMCNAALEWLVRDGIAASVSTVATWQNGKRLALAVTVTKPDATRQTFNYAWAWAQLGL